MYLHIGKNCVINDKDIIGIFDIEGLQNTDEYQNLYNKLVEENMLYDISSNQKNSFILTKEKNVIKGYISNIGTNTIKKRKIV
jgi:hypothetical protein